MSRRDRLSVVELYRLREYRLPGEEPASAAQRLPRGAVGGWPVRQSTERHVGARVGLGQA